LNKKQHKKVIAMSSSPAQPLPATNSEDPDVLKEAGNAAFKARNYDKAIELYSSALKFAKNDETKALCLSNRSAANQALKKWAEAVVDAKDCLNLKPGFAKGYYRLAIAQKKLGQFKEALETVNGGLKIAPGDASLKKARMGIIKKMKLGALTGSSSRGGGISQERMQEIQGDLQKLAGQRQKYRQKLMSLSHEADRAARATQRAALCEKQLARVPKATPLYAACGKMFIRSTRPETDKELSNNQANEARKEAAATKGKQMFAKKLKECEANIQELVNSVKR